MQLLFLMLSVINVFIIIHLINFTLIKVQQMKYLYFVHDLSNHMNDILKLIAESYCILLLNNDLKRYMSCFNNAYQYCENFVQYHDYKLLLLCLH